MEVKGQQGQLFRSWFSLPWGHWGQTQVYRSLWQASLPAETPSQPLRLHLIRGEWCHFLPGEVHLDQVSCLLWVLFPQYAVSSKEGISCLKSPSERCWVWWNTVLIPTLVGSRLAGAGGGWGEWGGERGGSGGGEAGEWGLEGNLSLSPRLKSSRFEPIPHTVVMPLISHLSSAVKLPEQLWSSCGYMTCALGTHLCLKHESAASPTVEFSSQTNTQNNPPCS